MILGDGTYLPGGRYLGTRSHYQCSGGQTGQRRHGRVLLRGLQHFRRHRGVSCFTVLTGLFSYLSRAVVTLFWLFCNSISNQSSSRKGHFVVPQRLLCDYSLLQYIVVQPRPQSQKSLSFLSRASNSNGIDFPFSATDKKDKLSKFWAASPTVVKADFLLQFFKKEKLEKSDEMRVTGCSGE